MSVGTQIVKEMLNGSPLGSRVKIDQDVCTQNNVVIPYENDFCIIEQIEPAKFNAIPDSLRNRKFISSLPEIFSPEGGGDISH